MKTLCPPLPTPTLKVLLKAEPGTELVQGYLPTGSALVLELRKAHQEVLSTTSLSEK